MLTLNVIGAGHLGQSLAYLLHHHAQVDIKTVLTQSKSTAQAAVAFIGAGQPACTMDDLVDADLYLIACPDRSIQACAEQLAQTALINQDSVVFHSSGALAASALQVLKQQGAAIASIHPIKSFAQPKQAIQHFAGTFCGVEGDSQALGCLVPLFQRIGATCFEINPEAKTLYHTASVMACNYLVALQEVSLQLFEAAAVPRSLAMQILQPLTQETLANTFEYGTSQALSGPIARGDYQLVETQLNALQAFQPNAAELYRLLGHYALALAQARGQADLKDLTELQQVLSR